MDIGAQSKATLQECSEEVFNMDTQELLQLVPAFFWERMHDSTKFKVYADLRLWRHRRAFILACQQVGMKYTQGPAPAGYMEDRIGVLIQGLSQ